MHPMGRVYSVTCATRLMTCQCSSPPASTQVAWVWAGQSHYCERVQTFPQIPVQTFSIYPGSQSRDLSLAAILTSRTYHSTTTARQWYRSARRAAYQGSYGLSGTTGAARRAVRPNDPHCDRWSLRGNRPTRMPNPALLHRFSIRDINRPVGNTWRPRRC